MAHALTHTNTGWLVTDQTTGAETEYPTKLEALLYALKQDRPRLFQLVETMATNHASACHPTMGTEAIAEQWPTLHQDGFLTRLLAAAQLVCARKVTLHTPKSMFNVIATVTGSNGDLYRVENGECTCPDFQARGLESPVYGAYCKHRLSVILASRYEGEAGETGETTVLAEQLFYEHQSQSRNSWLDKLNTGQVVFDRAEGDRFYLTLHPASPAELDRWRRWIEQVELKSAYGRKRATRPNTQEREQAEELVAFWQEQLINIPVL